MERIEVDGAASTASDVVIFDSIAENIPKRSTTAREDAKVAIISLGQHAEKTVVLGQLRHFAELCDWADWLLDGTSFDTKGSLPERISVEDDLIITANLVDNGFASQMVSQLVGQFGIIVGPISATGVINAPTLADAIQLVRRILVAGNPHLDIVVNRRADDFEIVFKSCLPDGSLREFYAAAMLVFVACCIIRYAPESQKSLQFDFDFAVEQGIVETIAAIASRVETQTATSRIVGRSQWLDMPSTAFDRSMWQLSLDRVQSMEADGLPADLEQRVRRYIKLSLAQEKRPPRLKQVAALEGVSERTMLRMLADNGLSFHLISEDVRRSLAGEMINLPSVSLSEIAESLGFTDLSSFSRSFRKWFGATPGQYRKSLEG